MSAFLVHDLKNTASALSLTLRNLPVHFNDPAFREDALRAIGKAVDHINGLISRLTSIKEGLRINSVEGDLNQLVAKTLESLGTGTAGDVEVVTDLIDLPKLSFDPEQIKKVLINLLLNAKEAVGAGGRIEVSTASRNGWAVVTVADNGCGMSPEFLDRCLFRPFQTTKKKGLGIGMFQSRMIVEAHRGKLEVESEQNKGTVFKVLLPLNRPAQKMESVT
jgi:signal transduction histidine kinase